MYQKIPAFLITRKKVLLGLDLQPKLNNTVTSCGIHQPHTSSYIIVSVFSSVCVVRDIGQTIYCLYISSIILPSADALQADLFSISSLKHFHLSHYYKMTEQWVVIRDYYWKKLTDCFYCHPIVHTNNLCPAIRIYKTQRHQNSFILNNFNSTVKLLQNQRMTSI